MATAEAAAATATVGTPPTAPQLQGLWITAIQSWFSRTIAESAPPWLVDFVLSAIGRIAVENLPPWLGGFVSNTNAAIRAMEPAMVNYAALDRQMREQQGRIDQLRNDGDTALEARTHCRA